MATTNIITINQLIKLFNDFSDSHLQLKDFGYGPTSEIGTTRQMNFPYLWVTHTAASTVNITNKTVIPQVQLGFIIVDKINIQENFDDNVGNNSDNRQEIISDTHQISLDLVTYITTVLNKFGIMLTEGSLSLENLNDETTDKVCGWLVTLELQLKHSNCSYPSNGISPVLPSNCAPVIVNNPCSIS